MKKLLTSPWVLLAAICLLRLPGFVFGVLNIDESDYLTYAAGIWKGLLPYRDLVEIKPPLGYFTYALAGGLAWPIRQRVGEVSARRLDLHPGAIGQEALPDTRGVGEVVGLVDVEHAEDEARQAQETDRRQQDPRRGEKLLHRRRRLVPRLVVPAQHDQ